MGGGMVAAGWATYKQTAPGRLQISIQIRIGRTPHPIPAVRTGYRL